MRKVVVKREAKLTPEGVEISFSLGGWLHTAPERQARGVAGVFPSISAEEIERKLRELYGELEKLAVELGGRTIKGKFVLPKDKFAVRIFTRMAQESFGQLFRGLAEENERRDLEGWLLKQATLLEVSPQTIWGPSDLRAPEGEREIWWLGE